MGRFLTDWLNSRTEPKAATLASYTKLVRNYVLPSALATMPLAKHTTKALETLYRTLSERGLSPRSVRYVHSILRPAFKTEVRDRVLDSNPAAGLNSRGRLPYLSRAPSARQGPLPLSTPA